MTVRQGIDIVSVRRIRQTISAQGSRFTKRVFSASEIAYCERMRMKFEHYAARFAAKEAFIKALSAQVKGVKNIPLKEIRVLRKATGKPYIQVALKARKKFRISKKIQIELSLAHEREFAIATVVAVLP